MNGCAAKVRIVSNRLWRPLIGVVIAYAVAAQTLLVALGGFSLPASAIGSTVDVELCLHDAADVQDFPVGNTKHSQCTNCIFCFGASHWGAIRPPTVLFHRVYLVTIKAPWTADKDSLPHLPAYSIANPRGPPIAA